MKIILFGATGMVGQGVLRESLLDPEVERVLAVGRAATGQSQEKFREIVHDDLFDLSTIEEELGGYDACLFCLGVSAAGMKEADYRRITYDLTLSVAQTLLKCNPAMTFLYVSGAGTDSSEKGRAMWARVKGETENALLKLPFAARYMIRPGVIQPMHGIKSKTKLYRVVYATLSPLYPLLRALVPGLVTTTEQVGRAMLAIAKRGAARSVVENQDLNEIARAG
jgi:uncharacterized protein YbjT (DUF2867 family)